MRKILLLPGVTILCLFFFLSSCAPAEVGEVEEIAEMKKGVEGIAKANLAPNETSEILGECTPSWKCISTSIKARQLENCSFGERKECLFGCVNNTCRIRKACETGFKCKGQHARGYQMESCDWISTARCEFGCEEGECLPEPEINETGAAGGGTGEEAEDEETAEVPTPAPILNEGETAEVNGQNLSIYLIEPERVKIKINNQRSDWLNEGDSYSNSGVRITIVGILFQSYQGGVRAVEYKVG